MKVEDRAMRCALCRRCAAQPMDLRPVALARCLCGGPYAGLAKPLTREQAALWTRQFYWQAALTAAGVLN